MWKAVLFDLDGTLLLSNEEEFYRTYFSMLAKFCGDLIESEKLLATIQSLIKELATTHAKENNYVRFLNGMKREFGEEKARKLERRFSEFYSTDFKTLKSLTSPNKRLLSWMKGLRAKKALATNPIFPEKAIVERLKWVGLEKHDFDLVSTMENFNYSKPQKEYYLEIAKRLNVAPQDCLMIGNDPLLDGSCVKAGMSFKKVEEFLN